MTRPGSARLRWGAVATAVALLAGCVVSEDDTAKQDTATVAPGVADSGAAPTPPTAGLPATGDTTAAVAADTGNVELHPAAPRRGGVIFALARGLVSTGAPRCLVDGEALPCYATNEGIIAVVPLPADRPAATRTLVFEHPTRRITRRIPVAEAEFGRELIFLDSAKYALVRRDEDISRDARALRQALSVETPERRWRGAWRDIAAGRKTSEYGVERFYHRASDSTRALTLAPSLRTRGAFAADTTRAGRADVPSWRHAGLDIPLARRAPVRAPAAGMVSEVGNFILSGRTVIVDHGQGVSTAYFHLDTVLVRKGENVTPQTLLGRVGDSGLTTGPHLHFGVYIHGSDVDPAAWLDMPAWFRGASAVANR